MASRLSIGPLATNFNEILIKIQKFFIQEITSEIIVCEMAAILSRGRWVKPIWKQFCGVIIMSPGDDSRMIKAVL